MAREPEPVLGTSHFRGVAYEELELGCDVAMEELTLAYERLEME